MACFFRLVRLIARLLYSVKRTQALSPLARSQARHGDSVPAKVWLKIRAVNVPSELLDRSTDFIL